MNIMEIFRRRQEANESMKNWERAIYKAGFESGVLEQQRLNKENGSITGLPSSNQIEQQVTEIMNRQGF